MKITYHEKLVITDLASKGYTVFGRCRFQGFVRLFAANVKRRQFRVYNYAGQPLYRPGKGVALILEEWPASLIHQLIQEEGVV